MKIENKVALITGAASGIGRAASLLFAREGARLVCVDKADAVVETAEMIHKAGGKARMEEVRDGLRSQVPWAVQNLETIWGGTKEWQG